MATHSKKPPFSSSNLTQPRRPQTVLGNTNGGRTGGGRTGGRATRGNLYSLRARQQETKANSSTEQEPESIEFEPYDTVKDLEHVLLLQKTLSISTARKDGTPWSKNTTPLFPETAKEGTKAYQKEMMNDDVERTLVMSPFADGETHRRALRHQLRQEEKCQAMHQHEDLNKLKKKILANQAHITISTTKSTTTTTTINTTMATIPFLTPRMQHMVATFLIIRTLSPL
jgi:hypothetical protein